MRSAFAVIVAAAVLGASFANFGAQTRAAVAEDQFSRSVQPVWTGLKRKQIMITWNRLTTVYLAKAGELEKRQEQQKKSQEAVARFGLWGPDLIEAAAEYGQDPETLYRVMICESMGDPDADNGVCKGLFQFNPGTWAGTPYASQNIFDGHAQIMAAAWMFSQGRKGEWTCQ